MLEIPLACWPGGGFDCEWVIRRVRRGGYDERACRGPGLHGSPAAQRAQVPAGLFQREYTWGSENVRRVIAGHSAHPSELDSVIRDLIPKLRAAGDLEAVTGLLSAELAADPGDFADVTTFSLGPDNRRATATTCSLIRNT